MGRKVYILTQGYPVMPGEDTFLAPEILGLSREFEVECVPLEIECKNQKWRFFKEAAALVKCPFQGRFLRQLGEDFKGGGFVKKVAYTLFVGYKGNLYADFLDRKIFRQGENAIVYSFWFNEICLGATSLKKKYPQLKIITRTHGYDLFDFRSPSGSQPFKGYMDRGLERVVFACDSAKSYYLKRYSLGESERYRTLYLGVPAQQKPPYNVGAGEELRIVSCSNAVGLKRIELIITALSLLCEVGISWSHFGGGEELERLEALAEKLLIAPNITYKFYGAVDNASYMEGLKKWGAQLFITASSTEGGVPVSIMEAQSLGLPVIATAVGGICEIVNSGNGTLLCENPTPEEIAAAIMEFYRLSPEEKQAKSQGAYSSWQEKFDSEKNSADFTKLLREL
ncbi:MAG: glycosyltransferase [Oscillospiraceae bacterium]